MTMNQFAAEAKLRERIAQLRGEVRQERKQATHVEQLLARALGLLNMFQDDLAQRNPPRVYEIDVFVKHAREVIADGQDARNTA